MFSSKTKDFHQYPFKLKKKNWFFYFLRIFLIRIFLSLWVILQIFNSLEGILMQFLGWRDITNDYTVFIETIACLHESAAFSRVVTRAPLSLVEAYG
jgi:hypothetical protein